MSNLRTYGRQENIDSPYGSDWVVVKSVNEDDEAVWFTDFLQALQLNLGDSPFFANIGISHESVFQRNIPPDVDLLNLINYYSQFFESITADKDTSQYDPVYIIRVKFFSGGIETIKIPVPTN